jgi:hypothetical protein
MLVVETIAKIRRAYFQFKKPIKQISRELRISRKTVRKVIRSGATEFTYERRSSRSRRSGPGGMSWTACWRERGAAEARAADADPDLRGAACPWL